MKKFLALILSAALLVGALTACGGKKAASGDGLEGTWRTEFDMADTINERMAASGMGEFLNISDFSITMVMEIRDDGTYAVTLDRDALADSLEGVKGQLKDGMVAYMEQMLKAQDPNADVDAALAAVDLDGMVEQVFNEEFMDQMTAVLKAEARYKAEDGKFYTSGSLDEAPGDNYKSYTLDGDTLTLDVGAADVPSGMEQFLPLVFTRA